MIADARAGSFRAATQLATIRHLIFGNAAKRRCLLCRARIRAGLSGKRLGLFGFLPVPGVDPAETSAHLVCEDCVKRDQTDAALRTAMSPFVRLKVGEAQTFGPALFEGPRPERPVMKSERSEHPA
jgi:hypothetical protein